MRMIAVGVPGWPAPSTRWDWWPLVGIVFALLIAGRALHLRLRAPVLVASVAVGPLFATLVHAWGAVPVLGIAILVGVAMPGARRRPHPRGSPPTV